MKRLWLFLSACGLLLVLLLTYFLSSSGILGGLIRGESFFRGRPTSHWLELVRADASFDEPQADLLEQFNSYRAFPVIEECFTDSDSRVRSKCIQLAARTASPGDLRKLCSHALGDSNPDVMFDAPELTCSDQGRSSTRIASNHSFDKT